MIPLLLATALLCVEDRASPGPPQIPTRAEVEASIDRGIEFLLGAQKENGAFGGLNNQTFVSGFANPATYHCWKVGTTGLGAQALLQVGKTPEAERAADRALQYLMANAKLVRPAEWDVDNNWSLIYGLTALCSALSDKRYAGTEKEPGLRAAAQKMVTGLEYYQGARGGWGYYADPDAAWRPDWGTSFTTAAAVLALLDARALGLEVDPKRFAAAVRALENTRLPNGAYDYDVAAVPRHLSMESINQVKGSLGRIQVCNHALLRAGVHLPANAIAEGVDQFFQHHKFLDVARNKPIPHEAYYANAAYFYLFGHYYASYTIERMPEPDRARRYSELQRELLKCQQSDGAFWDFWIADSTKPYGTAFAIMALHRSLSKSDPRTP